ncbi:hypothetical protein PGTUg99_034420 [Puccinia graminis f. sp. tritici]|uniref:Uncharacterized protein n=1 Tax=Puccinia graminis f. sp. tritici TaxID=56615 RepID=A0A5B0PP76_PUCGR|nr:hypothetical protein PGTUg99_034420 [Puccinia graminis f. sp. tritici]
MNLITIIVGIIISLTPACLAPSQITCEACKTETALEMRIIGKRPASGDCGESLGWNERCKLKRKKKYYKCKDMDCQAVTVKNLQCNYGAFREPCDHDNRFVYEPPITKNIEASSSETVVPSGTSAERPFYHFPIVSRDGESTSEMFTPSGTNSKNKYHHFL